MVRIVLAALMVLGSTQALAQKKGNKESLHDQFTGQGYGMAGCGLGSVVFGPKKGMIQIVAATLNGTGYQTFAISTGTSNCSEGAVFGKTNQFIETNKVALEKDLARGEGETLASLSQVMECGNNDFNSQLKNNYSQAFPQGGASTEQIGALAWKSCLN